MLYQFKGQVSLGTSENWVCFILSVVGYELSYLRFRFGGFVLMVVLGIDLLFWFRLVLVSIIMNDFVIKVFFIEYYVL